MHLMPRIRITASAHGTPGEALAVENGRVFWAGPLEEITEGWPFDALFCHDDDEERLGRFVATGQLGPKPIRRSASNGSSR
jgi:hypothetical protein